MMFPFPFVVIRIIMKAIILRDSSLLGFDFKKWQRFCVSREFILSRFVKFRWLNVYEIYDMFDTDGKTKETMIVAKKQTIYIFFFINITLIRVIGWDSLIFKHSLNISSDRKIRKKHLSLLNLNSQILWMLII